jgi:hypothetical protein
MSRFVISVSSASGFPSKPPRGYSDKLQEQEGNFVLIAITRYCRKAFLDAIPTFHVEGDSLLGRAV